jgi:hypothetical protein
MQSPFLLFSHEEIRIDHAEIKEKTGGVLDNFISNCHDNNINPKKR